MIVATGTASGKTLAFNLPVLEALARDPRSRALYLYPTKALARDQARALTAFGLPFLRPALYDGDTAPEQRRQLRTWANVLLTNPDLVHVGLLPHHDRFGDVLANLRYVVVDEAHVYRGVFGSHVANVLRRLRRIAAAYGAAPQFLLASATVANPGELGERLTGQPVEVVDRDGAPRAERTVALWNPPLLDPALGLRASALGEGARLLAGLVEAGLRTICFAKSRRAAELVHRFAAERLEPGLARRLSPYRAGTTPEQRREIERRLVDGELLGIATTDALEHGIDVGLLDCAISVGFPGTVASLLQQWGRAGRRDAGLAVLVATDDALDQFFMRDPEALLARRVEAAILDHRNQRVLDGHVRAAAFEAPISESDRGYLGDEALERADSLTAAGELRRTPAGYVWAGATYPAARVSLRSAGAESVSIVDAGSGEVLGAVDEARACTTVHEGAIYLHLGSTYRVLELDLAGRVALVEPFAGDYFTQTKRDTATVIERVARAERWPAAELCFGEVSVTERVVGYQKRLVASGDALELRRPRPPRAGVPDRGGLAHAGAVSHRRARGALGAARRTPRGRARADLDAAAARDVRSLGHRRALDEHPLPDRGPGDLRLRRPRGRDRDRGAGLRELRRLGRGHGGDARGMPLRAGLPVVRPVAEVRQPERAPRQGRGARAPVRACPGYFERPRRQRPSSRSLTAPSSAGSAIT